MIGQHLLIDFFGVEPFLLKDVLYLGTILEQSAHNAKLTPVQNPHFHVFEGGGVTGFLLLSESHMALHTYPEYGYIALDIFACGAGNLDMVLISLRQAFMPLQEKISVTPRGLGARL